jgi:hypothetical protein
MRKLGVLALVMTAACVDGGGGTPLPEASVQVDSTRGAEWPPARGEAALIVRAVTRDAAGVERELAGARCAAGSPYYAAEFTAPARVLVPDFGTASPAIEVTCRAGEAEGRAVSRPELAGTRGFYGWPGIGISVGTGNVSGVGVGFGWQGGGTGYGTGVAAIRYPALRVVVE